MKIETKCVQEGYTPGNNEPRTMPIYQSTTYKFDSSEYLGQLFDLKESGHIYTRISNPTLEHVENKIASLEGGVGAMLTSSGQSASFLAVLNICKAGDHIISAKTIYGGVYNQFAVTLKKLGIDCTFVDSYDSEDEIQKAFKENTKAVYGESLANPALTVLDIEKFARVAHRNNVPLIVDNTFPTPVLCRPFEFGADIIVHSATKYMDGHATVVAGAIIDSGNFDWSAGKFPEFTNSDKSYHGVSYVRDFGKAAYITKARVQLMRDLGCCIPPLTAFILNLGLETLHLRMERHSQNALIAAKFLEAHPNVLSVNYPGLKSNRDHELCIKYLPHGASGVISFRIKGGYDAAVKFMDSLKLASIVVHVADARTCVLHPASTTHRQLPPEQREAAGAPDDLIRLSVGIENIDDILEDISQAFQ